MEKAQFHPKEPNGPHSPSLPGNPQARQIARSTYNFSCPNSSFSPIPSFSLAKQRKGERETSKDFSIKLIVFSIVKHSKSFDPEIPDNDDDVFSFLRYGLRTLR
ncbi:hypothetical protein V6N13_087330 [Hibiscus sabdariffa]|uniref:Uncharacterized protein n=1 Tax=Hibiscus sabdariffa TaxID=183260 RepID=A0ABR2FWQ2_9ROSI